MWIVGLLAYAVLCAGICTHLARRRVADESWWALWGLLFGILAIGYLLMMPPVFGDEGAGAATVHGAAPGKRKGKKRAD